MTTAKTIEIGWLGEEPQRLNVQDSWTVSQACEAAGFSNYGTVYGVPDNNGSNDILQSGDSINGYKSFILSTGVKGGQ